MPSLPISNRVVLFLWMMNLSLVPLASTAQRVGLVLSGGGAKGLAHVGVLKALEENNIPIDYLAGTSMGGVIAGCYAAGLTPNQIEEMVLSEAFQRWINGKSESGHNYYYSKDEVNPSFIRINLSLDSTLNFNLKSNLASDHSLNFALAEKFSVPSAIAKNNFDSLFVPLRVVASEIFTQNEIILKSGALSDALRATHTVPFFYEPIRIDGKFLFDGGVYNNFPVDVMQKDFSPDAIIGVNVTSKVFEKYPFGEDEKLVDNSLLYMLLDKSDPAQIPTTGIYIQPNLSGYSSINFSSVRQLIDSGYAQTIRQMPEIKSKVTTYRMPMELSERRKVFLAKRDTFVIDKVSTHGFNSKQQKYVKRFFPLKKGPISINKVKSGYYDLVSDEYFKNVYPGFSKDTTHRHFELGITERPQKNFQVDFGGIISNRNISSMFLGVNYYYFNRALNHYSLNINVGSFYKSIQLKTRIDIPLLGRFYLDPEFTLNDWNYLSNRDLIIGKKDPTILRRFDIKAGGQAGVPIFRQVKLSLFGYYMENSDRYSNYSVLISSDTLDLLKVTGWRTGLMLETEDFNRKQYASKGKHFLFKFDWFDVIENFTPGTTSTQELTIQRNVQWWRLKLSAEQYLRTGAYSWGYFGEAVFSNQPTFSNYFGTMINAPAFYPLQDSRTLLIPKFRSFNYVAVGIRNVFSIRPNFDFRLEGYVFKPIEAILQGNDQLAELSTKLTRINFAGMASLVLHSTVGPVSLSFNYYDDKTNQFGLLFHIGYLLFQKPSME
jgi:NTE family protein